MVLAVLSAMEELPGALFAKTEVDGTPCVLDLRRGGCPSIHPEHGGDVHYANPYWTENEKELTACRQDLWDSANLTDSGPGPWWVTEGSQEGVECWNLSETVRLVNERVYLLSDRKDKYSVFVCHTTGDVIRPRFVRLDVEEE